MEVGLGVGEEEGAGYAAAYRHAVNPTRNSAASSLFLFGERLVGEFVQDIFRRRKCFCPLTFMQWRRVLLSLMLKTESALIPGV